MTERDTQSALQPLRIDSPLKLKYYYVVPSYWSYKRPYWYRIQLNAMTLYTKNIFCALKNIDTLRFGVAT